MRPCLALAVFLLVLVSLIAGSSRRAHAQEPIRLESLTVSPAPEEWPTDPTHPDDPPERGLDELYIALFADDMSRGEIPEASISIVPVDPAVVITVNGIEVASGEPFTSQWERRVPWLDFEVELTGSGGASSNFTLVLLNQYVAGGGRASIAVEPNLGIVSSGPFLPGKTATMTVRAEPGGAVLATATGTVTETENHVQWILRELGIPVDLKPGMEVSVTDGELTITYVVMPLTIDEVDFETDTVRGSGLPGAALELIIDPVGEDQENSIEREVIFLGLSEIPEAGAEEPIDPRFIVDGDGMWEVNVSAEGVDLTEASSITVLSTFRQRMNFADPEQRPNPYDPFDITAGVAESAWPVDVPDPGIVMVMDIDLISVEGIQPGLTANVIVRTEPGGEILFTGEATASVDGEAGWARPELSVRLIPGMEVSVSWGEITFANVLLDISVVETNAGLDLVHGTGPPGESILLIVGDFLEGVFSLAALEPDVLIDEDGLWSHNFAGGFDVQVGMLAVVIMETPEGSFGAASVAEIVPIVEETNTQSSEVSDIDVTLVDTESADGTSVVVEVPAGALPTGSTIEVAVIVNQSELVDQVALPENTDIVLGFRISATGVDGSAISGDFGSPITLHFVIEASAIPEGIPIEELTIAFWNGTEWVALSDVSVTENPDGSINLETQTDHFTIFAVFHDPTRSIGAGPADPIDEMALPGLFSEFGINLPGLPSEIDINLTDLPQENPDTDSRFLTNPLFFGPGIVALLAILIGVAFGIRHRMRRPRPVTEAPAG